MGHEYTPIFFDMDLLTKVLETTSGRSHLYGSTGPHHLLSDSGIFAAGTVQQILRGKDFDCGMYTMKLIDKFLHTVC